MIIMNGFYYQCALLDTYTDEEEVVCDGEKIPFMVNRVSMGCGLSHTPEATTTEITKPGYYLVYFNADAEIANKKTETTDEKCSYLVTLQLKKNDADVAGAMSTVSIRNGDVENFSFSTIIRILPSCCVVNNNAALAIEVVGESLNIINTEFIVTQL